MGSRSMTGIPKNRWSAYALFKEGHSTLSIAKLLGIREPQVVKMLDEARSHKLGLPEVKYASPSYQKEPLAA